jgi:hypothetical protein
VHVAKMTMLFVALLGIERDMLEKTRRIVRDKLDPLLFTSTEQQINITCIKLLFEPSSSIHL